MVVGDDISISSDGKFTMPEGNVTVKAVFQVHSYGDWQIGDSEHWRQCSCGAVSEKTDHADSDQGHKCDVCDKTLMEHTGGKATAERLVAGRRTMESTGRCMTAARRLVPRRGITTA